MRIVEKPKIRIIKKSSPLEIKVVRAERSVAEEILDYMVSGKPKKRFAPENYLWANGKIDYRFGQEWNYGSLESTDDIFYLTYKTKHYPDLTNKFYEYISQLNPSLKDITVNTNERKRDLLRGVGSRLHYNDIKYFVENLKGTARNDNLYNKILWRIALVFYTLRNPSKFKNEEKIKRGFGGDIDFVLNPETAKRVILNRPYNP